MFSCEFYEISHYTFTKEPFGRLLLQKYLSCFSEAATKGVLCKKLFLEISQNSQENACARVSYLINLQAKACNFIK